MSKWERKLGKYAIPNLTIVLIACYVVGYALNAIAPNMMNYLTLDPYAIIHGQIWRIVTWVIAPPTALTSGYSFFLILIMLMFYFNLGTSLERVWGVWRYNVYIIGGMLITVIGSLLCMAICYLFLGNMEPEFMRLLFKSGAVQFSTYYINMSIFLAYAATFPTAEVLLMFFIPVKVKWLGIIYGVMLVIEMLQYISSGIIPAGYLAQISNAAVLMEVASRMVVWFRVAAIGASLLNFLIFWMRMYNHMHLNPKQIKRRVEFKQDIRRNPKITKHKCAVCGQTEEDNPGLEFRFCSKCNGNYEYCQNHLFTHEHVK